MGLALGEGRTPSKVPQDPSKTLQEMSYFINMAAGILVVQDYNRNSTTVAVTEVEYSLTLAVMIIMAVGSLWDAYIIFALEKKPKPLGYMVLLYETMHMTYSGIIVNYGVGSPLPVEMVRFSIAVIVLTAIITTSLNLLVLCSSKYFYSHFYYDMENSSDFKI